MHRDSWPTGVNFFVANPSTTQYHKGDSPKSPHIYTPRKLTCPRKGEYFNRKYIFQPLIFRGHVSFPGSTSTLSQKNMCPISLMTPVKFLTTMQFVRHPTRDPGFFRSFKMSFDHLTSLISLTRQTVRLCPNLSLEEEPQPDQFTSHP